MTVWSMEVTTRARTSTARIRQRCGWLARGFTEVLGCGASVHDGSFEVRLGRRSEWPQGAPGRWRRADPPLTAVRPSRPRSDSDQSARVRPRRRGRRRSPGSAGPRASTRRPCRAARWPPSRSPASALRRGQGVEGEHLDLGVAGVTGVGEHRLERPRWPHRPLRSVHRGDEAVGQAGVVAAARGAVPVLRGSQVATGPSSRSPCAPQDPTEPQAGEGGDPEVSGRPGDVDRPGAGSAPRRRGRRAVVGPGRGWPGGRPRCRRTPGGARSPAARPRWSQASAKRCSAWAAAPSMASVWTRNQGSPTSSSSRAASLAGLRGRGVGRRWRA